MSLAKEIIDAMPLHPSVDEKQYANLLEWIASKLQPDSKFYLNAEGEVGVVYCANYGIGWYSHIGDKHPDCATDPTLVELVVKYRKEREIIEEREDVRSWELYDDHELIKPLTKPIYDYIGEKYSNTYCNASSFDVKFFPQGVNVEVEEHDGLERLHISYRDDTIIRL